MSRYPLVPLGEVLIKSDDFVSIQPDEHYETAGILNKGRGLFKRPTISGSETRYTKYNRLHSGQFVYSKLFAWEGSLATVPPEFDGLFVSHEFPTFDIIEERAFPGYIAHLTRWPELHSALSKQTSGMGSRRQRVNIDRLLSARAPIPDISEQRKLAEKLDSVHQKTSRASLAQKNAQDLRSALRRTLVELPLDFDARHTRIGDVISLVRRPVEVAPDQLYREIGLRSFGKGVFHKVPASGESIANKKVFHIKPGDLLFSNVFAWEGAVAIASEQEADFIGSHRFMTYQVNEHLADPTYLLHYFCYGPGLDTIRAASPGSAGRNRTLGITAFANQTMTLPSLDKQRHIAKQLSRLAQAEQISEVQSAELSALSTAILNAAFTGQL